MKGSALLKKLFLIILLLTSTLLSGFGGNILDVKTNKPIIGAIIEDSRYEVKSDQNGSFSIDSKESLFHIKAYGYRRYSFSQDSNTTTFKLAPIRVKALYLTFWGASNNSKTLKRILNIIDKTDVNAIVMDVKNEYGSTSFLTSFKQANRYGAAKKRTNRDIKKFMQTMKQKNIYTIARIVTFKDELQASHNPSYAIKREDNGTIWRNHDKMAWVDPFHKKAHNYTIAIAKEAAKVGFDEINFDYIRFPAKTGLKFSKENTRKNRIKAIGTFLERAKTQLRKYGVFISVDTYGNICWSKDDNGIGQTVASFAKHTDYLCPMLYPSGFASGSFYFKYPSEHPYEVVYRSIKHIRGIIDPKRVRPWLQYFKDYTKRKKHYKKFEVQEQIRAADNIGTNGWMLWSPSSKYHLEYLNKD